MGQSTHFATLFISLGVVGMMIGSMLAKVLTDRWCKLQVFSGPTLYWQSSPVRSTSLIRMPQR